MHYSFTPVLAEHAHVFFVHSSITEILAHRITQSIVESGIGNPRFHYIVGRNYSCALLPSLDVCQLEPSSRWLIGYEHARGNICDFARAFHEAKDLVKHLKTFTLYVPHAKLRIARALITHEKCINYYIYEEGFLSHLSFDLINEHFSISHSNDYTLRDRLYLLKLKFRSLLVFLFSGGEDVNRLLWFYLFGCYANPEGFFFFWKSKHAGMLSLLPQAFPDQHANKLLFPQPTKYERALLHHLHVNYHHLIGLPILLVHSADKPQDITSSFRPMKECGIDHFILRPHPSLLHYSFPEVCRIKQIDHRLMIADSLSLLNYPLEMLVKVLRSPLINQGSSSISLYTKIYNQIDHLS